MLQPVGFSLSISNFKFKISDFSIKKTRQAEQTAEKVGRFVGRGFSHDVNALDSSGVFTPEARKYHFSSTGSACGF